MMQPAQRAFGRTDAGFSQPQIGVAATWNRVTPCNRILCVNSVGTRPII
jgi:dihydroxyacid dehydratase/phosphogluconate dehydratase